MATHPTWGLKISRMHHQTYSLETCDEFYEFESLPEMQIMELLTSEIILPTE